MGVVICTCGHGLMPIPFNFKVFICQLTKGALRHSEPTLISVGQLLLLYCKISVVE